MTSSVVTSLSRKSRPWIEVLDKIIILIKLSYLLKIREKKWCNFMNLWILWSSNTPPFWTITKSNSQKNKEITMFWKMIERFSSLTQINVCRTLQQWLLTGIPRHTMLPRKIVRGAASYNLLLTFLASRGSAKYW